MWSIFINYPLFTNYLLGTSKYNHKKRLQIAEKNYNLTSDQTRINPVLIVNPEIR